jgi:RIO kinase 1
MARITRERFKIRNNVFDQFTIRNLFKLSSEGFFEDLYSSICLGKEANIFTAKKKDGSLIIVKIYRLENCNFNKMFDYIKQDPRYEHLSERRREIIFSWVQREFRNLLKAREVIRVPSPIKVKDNIILMELIGNNDELSPELKDSYPKNPEEFYDKIIDNIIKLYRHGLVHGDLSHFNILNNNDEPIFIDFSQATVTKSGQAEELLRRDVDNIVKFFNNKLGLHKNTDETIEIIHKAVKHKNQ